jgi:hypothetical protein
MNELKKVYICIPASIFMTKPEGVPIACLTFWMNHVQLDVDSISITPYATGNNQLWSSIATAAANCPMDLLVKCVESIV